MSIEKWTQKLAALQKAEAIASDPAQQFQLAEQIVEARSRLKELDANPVEQKIWRPSLAAREKLLIVGAPLTLTSLLIVAAQYTGAIFWGSVVGIALFTGLSLFWLATSTRCPTPDARSLTLDPEQNPSQFVGRQADLRSLAQCLDEGQLIFLSGESGSGKSVLIKVGLQGYLENRGSDLRLLPIVVDGYGASENWDSDLSTRVASRFADSLSPHQRETLSLPKRVCTTQQLVELLGDCGSRIGRVPLLIFDQFDDYQNLHRDLFLRDRKWITPETLATENNFWNAVKDALKSQSIKVLLVTRRDRFDSLESLRVVLPRTYPLSGIMRDDIRGVLGDILTHAGLRGAESIALQHCVLDDLTDEAGEVLPIQAALAFKGLSRLAYLAPREYRRKGGARSLQVSHVRRGIIHLARVLRISRSQSCALFRSMVDDSSPPKAAIASTADLAGRVHREEAEMHEAMCAFARPAMQLVRKRIESTDVQASEWSLYHDFLASLVLDVQRELDSANALLEKKHAEFRSANSWASRWKTLLAPWESLCLIWAVARRRVQMTCHRRYVALSTLRFFPLVALIGSLWAGGITIRELAANAEALSVLAAVEAADLSNPPVAGELKHLESLAGARWPVKRRFIHAVLQSPPEIKRFAMRVDYLTHAIVGIDSSYQKRAEFLRVLATAPLAKTSDAIAIRGMWRARLVDSAPAEFSRVKILAASDLIRAMQSATGSGRMTYLNKELTALATNAGPSFSIGLAEEIVSAIQTTADSLPMISFALALASLADNIEEDPIAHQAAEKIVEAIHVTEDPLVLASLTRGLAFLVDKIDAKIVSKVTAKMVDAMEPSAKAFHLSGLARSLAELADSVDSTLVTIGRERLVEAMHVEGERVDVLRMSRLAQCLAESDDPTLVVQGAEKLIEAMQTTIHERELLELSYGLSHLAEKSDSTFSNHIAETVVDEMCTTDDTSRLAGLYLALANFAHKVDPKSSDRVGKKILKAMAIAENERLYYLAVSLAALANKIDERIAGQAVELVVAAMRDTTDPAQLHSLCRSLMDFVDVADPQLRIIVAEKASEALRRAERPSSVIEVCAGVAGLVKRIDPKLSHQAAQKVVDAMDVTTDYDQLDCLSGELSELAAQVDPRLVAVGLLRIVEVMPEPLWTNHSYEFSPFRLAKKVDSEFSLPVAEEIIEAMQSTSEPEMSLVLMHAFADVAKKIDSGSGAVATEMIAEALPTTADPRRLLSLMYGLVCLTKRIDPVVGAAVTQRIIEAMRSTTDRDQLRSLTEGVSALGEKLDPEFSAALADQLVAAMLGTTDYDQLRSFAQCLSKLKKVEFVNDPQSVVQLLKRPLAAAENGYVLNSLAGYLGRGLQGKPFPDLQSLIHWANANPQVALNLDGPY